MIINVYRGISEWHDVKKECFYLIDCSYRAHNQLFA